MLVLTTKRREEGMEGMEEENSCPFVPLDNALGGPDPLWVCGGQPRAHGQEAGNS